MKPYLKIATHAVAVVIGAALASAVLPALDASRAAGKSGSELAANESASEAGKVRTKASGGPRGESRSAAYRSAWAALSKEPLGIRARMLAQQKLLAEWAKIDLHGAIQAYLGEAWDARNPNTGSPSPLADAFTQEFAKHPEGAWAALAGDKMATQLLGQTWLNSVGSKNPDLVISLLGTMPENLHPRAIGVLVQDNPFLTPEMRNELIAKIATSGTPAQVESWMARIYRQDAGRVDPSTLSAKWSAMPASGERTQQMAAWASSMRTADTTKFADEWAKVPAEDRGQAARMLLAQVDNKSPALTTAIDHAVEAGEWQALSAGVADKLRGFQTDRQALAEWALTLPPREEVRAIFNLAISEKLLADPAGGRAWLEQLPAGDWHRERGFIEMTLGNLWVRGDIAAANRAIDAITDPRAREEALKVRYDWQLLTRQPDVIRVR